MVDSSAGGKAISMHVDGPEVLSKSTSHVMEESESPPSPSMIFNSCRIPFDPTGKMTT